MEMHQTTMVLEFFCAGLRNIFLETKMNEVTSLPAFSMPQLA